MRAVKYGTTRDYVRAMTVVLPTGEIVHEGATVSKTSSGYSLLNLIIGSEGTLGIITELTLKVIPKPTTTMSLIIPFETLDEAIAVVPLFFKNHLSPQALEFMEKEAVEETEEYLGKKVYPKEVEGTPVNAYILATFDGDSEDQIMDIIEQASDIVTENGALDVLVADTPKLLADMAGQKRSARSRQANTDLLDECDVVVPINKRSVPALCEITGTGLRLQDQELRPCRRRQPAHLHLQQRRQQDGRR